MQRLFSGVTQLAMFVSGVSVGASSLVRGARALSTSSICSLAFKIAVVGTGPAGFYTAHHLLHKALKYRLDLKLDFFERLPAPYGLSRYGVAPDHPEVKNCEEYLQNIMTDFKADVRFFGNVNVGKDVSLKDLEANYHSVVLAYGCVNADNKLNIPGNDLPGVISARQFVNWYNGHPDSYSAATSFKPPRLDVAKSVTLIGNGNVALDVARILLADPKDHWASTDISADALKVLLASSVNHVNIVARRGLLESAFTNKEIRELLELNSTKKVKFLPIDDEIFDAIQPYIKKVDRVNKRRLSILEKYSSPENYEPEKTWNLQYLKSPKEFIVNQNNPDFLSKTVFTRNKIVHDDATDKPKFVTDDTAGPVEIENDLVVLSIGYKGSELNGFEDNDILFDEAQNRIINKGGKIIASSSTDLKNPVFKNGFYTSGWIKNGPKGVIATTMMDSFDTAENILHDLANNVHTGANLDVWDIEQKLSHLTPVTWDNWLTLNDYELETGAQLGKSREKVCQVEQMLEISCK